MANTICKGRDANVLVTALSIKMEGNGINGVVGADAIVVLVRSGCRSKAWTGDVSFCKDWKMATIDQYNHPLSLNIIAEVTMITKLHIKFTRVIMLKYMFTIGVASTTTYSSSVNDILTGNIAVSRLTGVLCSM